MLAGMASVPVAMWLEARLAPDMSAMNGPLTQRIWLSLFVAGPVEESCKIVAVTLLIWFQSNFDEPLDGIVYAAAAAAGVALVENLLFMRGQPSSVVFRGPAATGASLFFAGFWGAARGHAIRRQRLLRRAGLHPR